MIGSVGMTEIMIVLVIALLIFGPKQLPKVGRSLGEFIQEMKGVGRQLTGEDEDEGGL